jgi:hypothetical protein
MNDQDNDFGLICPQCKTGDQIDIQAAVWVRLCPDGTDVTAAENGDHDGRTTTGRFAPPAATKAPLNLQSPVGLAYRPVEWIDARPSARAGGLAV